MVQTIASAAAKLGLVALIANGVMTAQQALIWFAWVYVLENSVLAVGYLIMYGRHGGSWREWRVSRSMAAYLMQQSWPMLVYGMALYVQARIDQVMIKDILGRSQGEVSAYAEVGQYSVALKMIEALGFLPVIVQKSLAPAITKAKARDHELYKDRLLNLYRLMFFMFLVTAVPLYIFAEPLIVVLYGEEFRPAGFLLGLFAIRLFFTNMGTGKSSFITNESLFKYSLITSVIGAAVNIGVNYLMIPSFKSIGAIWATIISFLVSIFLLDVFLPKTRENLRLMVKGIFTFWKFHRAT
jgi:O-antigen/teichoic acid export membrane protein